MKLYRGVQPYVMPFMETFFDMIRYMETKLPEDGMLTAGDIVVILSGAPGGEAKSVDFLQIYKIR